MEPERSAPTLATLEEILGSDYLSVPGRETHPELLAAVDQPGDVALRVDRGPSGRWTVAVCMADALGALSILAGLFTSYRLDIVRADIFTVRGWTASAPTGRRRWPRPGSRPMRGLRRLLDVFEVRDDRGLAEDVWDRFEADLRRLVALLATEHWEDARAEIIDQVSQVFREAAPRNAPQSPVAIDVSNEPLFTRITVRSTDNVGFLFAFTNALAGITVNIERATIRTDQGDVVDTFWVTDVSGRSISHEGELRELRIATALIKQFTDLLPHSPDPGQALHQFTALIQQMLSRPQWTAELTTLDEPKVLETLAELMGVSRFLWEDFLRLQHENLFPLLLAPDELGRAATAAALREALDARLRGGSPSAQVDALNAFKDREMFRIDLRHITGRSDFLSFSRELTDLAQVALGTAATLAFDAQVARNGLPLAQDGAICRWCIGALGKFGGEELGFGSDLEIVLVFETEGDTAGPLKVRNSELFANMMLAVKEGLRARQEGIFQLDLRLRPYGDGGALASSLAGYAGYYHPGGSAEQFERMALVKLRPVLGDLDLGARVVAVRDEFVYSNRPLDVANVLHLRRRQGTELVPKGQVNAKYSSGGLVDVEYFVQTWQIAAGANDPSVRVTNTLLAIDRLEAAGTFAPERAAEIRQTYGFLRRLIDGLRVVRGNAKDLTIPPERSREHSHLAQRLGFEAPAALSNAIRDRMTLARSLWQGELPHWEAPAD
ncbi:MAG: hypothetical protein U0556_12765 [Dehalococcoidia bacterium]